MSDSDITKLNKLLKKIVEKLSIDNDDDVIKLKKIDIHLINCINEKMNDIEKKNNKKEMVKKILNIVDDDYQSVNSNLIKKLCENIELIEIEYDTMNDKIEATTVVQFDNNFKISRYAYGYYDDPRISIYVDDNYICDGDYDDFIVNKEMKKIINKYDASKEEKKVALIALASLFTDSFEVWRY
jgi:hypothetical protein